jgi:plasmid stabilization system protein ParE
MNYRLIVKPEAESDIDEAKRWYRRQRKRLAAEFVEEVGKVLVQLQRMPKMHGMSYKDVRRALVVRFPYSVFYRVVRRQVRILAVMHQRRDPAAWQSRADAD